MGTEGNNASCNITQIYCKTFDIVVGNVALPDKYNSGVSGGEIVRSAHWTMAAVRGPFAMEDGRSFL